MKSFRECAVSLVKDNDYKVVAEIGVWRGDLSRLLYPIVDLLILVDPWSQVWNNFAYGSDTYRCTMGEDGSRLRTDAELDQMHLDVKKEFPKAKILRMCSEAAAITEVDDRSLDFVFIDACHTYENCLEDIDLWLPKVKAGGILAGDDYVPQDQSVARAVDERLGSTVTVIGDRVWYRKV